MAKKTLKLEEYLHDDYKKYCKKKGLVLERTTESIIKEYLKNKTSEES